MPYTYYEVEWLILSMDGISGGDITSVRPCITLKLHIQFPYVIPVAVSVFEN